MDFGRGLISADSHVEEPEDLWLTRLPAHLRDRAPRYEQGEDGMQRLIVEGHRLGWSKRSKEDRERRAAAVDPQERLANMDLDAIYGEVMYPTTGLHLWKIADAELGEACMRVYNDYVAETYARTSERFRPPGMIPMYSPRAAAEEMRRIDKLGIRAAMIPLKVEHLPYNYPDYDVVWSTAVALSMPMSFHNGTGYDMIFYQGPGSGVVNYATSCGSALQTHALLVMSGVMERFPDAHWTAVECGGGWMAWLMNVLDEGYTDLNYMASVKLKELPSFYLKRQAHATFQDDPVAVAARAFTGTFPLLWGNDYPHDEGTWPHSREAIERQMAGVREDDVRDIVSNNAARIWGF